MKFFISLFLVSLSVVTALAQDHVHEVYGRENDRLEKLMNWSPGESRPELPPVIKFDREKIKPPEPKPMAVKEPLRQRNSGLPQGHFTAWIVEYNRGIRLSQADLISRTIVDNAAKHGVDPNLVVALVAAESAFRADARSPVGAQGLGQLMPGTAAMLGVSQPYEPVQNLSGTVRYLSNQIRRFGSPALALAAYNAGPGAVQKYGGVPPYRETQQYVSYVLGLYEELKSFERRQTVVSGKIRSDS